MSLYLLAIGPFTVIAIIFTIASTILTLSTRPGNRGYDSDPTYSFTNLGNNRGEGGPPPVSLGKRNRIKPQIVSTTISTTKGQQTFRGLYLLGRGEIASMESDWRSRLRINGRAATGIPGMTATFRYGTSGQQGIPGAEDVGAAYDNGTDLRGIWNNAGVYTTQTVGTHEIRDSSARTLQLLFVARGGIYQVDKKGNQRESAAGCDLEFYDSVTKSWRTINVIDTYTSGTLAKVYRSGYYIYVDIANENTEWSREDQTGKGPPIAGRIFAVNSTRSPVNFQLNVHMPDPALVGAGRITQIRVKGIVPNDQHHVREMTWTTTIEVKPDTSTHAGYALMYLEGLASEEIQGGVPEVELDTTGVLVTDPRTGVTAESENPGVLVREILRNTVWGLGLDLPAGILDDGSGGTFRAFMDACDATVTPSKSNGLTAAEAQWRCNYVLGTRAGADEHFSAILAACRATLYESQGLLKIAWDASGASVRTFDARKVTTNRRNVVEAPDGRSSIVEAPLPEEQRYNLVRVLYVDSADGYQKRTVELSAGAAVGVTETERVLELQLFCVAYRSQATRECRYHLNLAAYSTRMVQLLCGYGDADLEPENKFTVYDDYRYPSGKVFRVVGSGWAQEGRTSLRGREYSASVYSDNTDTVTVTKSSESAGAGATKGTSSAPAAPAAESSSAASSAASSTKGSSSETFSSWVGSWFK